MKKRKEHPTARYERWWRGKLCRPAMSNDPKFRRVTSLRFVGPPSFVYGHVWLVYEDGSDAWVNTTGFRPRRSDVHVQAESGVGEATA